MDHSRTPIAAENERFLVPFAARQYYGTDAGYLIIRDYPLETFVERMEFICPNDGSPRGIVEICLRGEKIGDEL